jgi:hypothetical protein
MFAYGPDGIGADAVVVFATLDLMLRYAVLQNLA